MAAETVFDLTTGTDTPVLSPGNDTINAAIASSLNAADVIDGGDGEDTLVISANQNVTFGATTLTNVERVEITAGTLIIVTNDATVASGQTLVVDASASAGSINWDGRAELDGAFDITGGGIKDTIRGGAGVDTLSGGGGNDTMYGGGGGDILYGGEGNDFLYAENGDDIIYGNEGNDGISGGEGADLVYGGSGSDTLIGGNGNDTLSGGDDNDWLWGQGDDDLLYGGTGNDTVSGDAGNDTLYGEDGADILRGLADNDTLYGGADNDTLSGGTGIDTLYGEAGDDSFHGTVSEFNGDTIMDFQIGDQIMVSSVDLSSLNGTTASGSLDLGGGSTLTMDGITSASGTWEAIFASGNTTITLVAPVPAPSTDTSPPVTQNTVDGVTTSTQTINNADGTTSRQITVPVVSTSRDESQGNSSTADIPLVSVGGARLVVQVEPGIGLTVSGMVGQKSPANSLTDLIREIQSHTTAGSQDQSTFSSAGTSFLESLSPDTPVTVQSITPRSTGTGSNNTLTLVATAGDITLTSAVVIDTRSSANLLTIVLDNIDFATVAGAVTLSGGSGSQQVWGDSAAQTIILGEGDDILRGGGGDDVVGSEAGNDRLFGDDGNDTVFGGQGDDRLSGGSGNDTLDGGDGVDAARFDMNAADATLRFQEDGSLLVNAQMQGQDQLTGVELLHFQDTVMLVQVPTTFNNSAWGTPVTEAFYLAQNPDVQAAVEQGAFASGVAHYLAYGANEGRNPNALFNEAWYRTQYADVNEAIEQGLFANAYQHYALYGAGEQRLPSMWFDPQAYLLANPDVAAAGMDPLTHYLNYGAQEGRIVSAAFDDLWS